MALKKKIVSTESGLRQIIYDDSDEGSGDLDRNPGGFGEAFSPDKNLPKQSRQVGPVDRTNFNQDEIISLPGGPDKNLGEKIYLPEQEKRIERPIIIANSGKLQVGEAGRISLAEGTQKEEDAVPISTDLARSGFSFVKRLFNSFIPETPKSIGDAVSILASPFNPKGLESPAVNRVAGDFLSGIMGGASGQVASIASLSVLGEEERQSLEDVATKMRDIAIEVAPEDPNFLDYLISGAGSMALFGLESAAVAGTAVAATPIASGMALAANIPRAAQVITKLAPLVGQSVLAISESATEAGNVYLDQIQKGLSREEASASANVDFWGNIVLNSITQRFTFFNNSPNLNRLSTFIKRGTPEAIQESLQSIIASKSKDEEISKEDVFVGLGTGFLLGGGSGLALSKTPNQNKNSTSSEIIIKAAQSEASGNYDVKATNIKTGESNIISSQEALASFAFGNMNWQEVNSKLSSGSDKIKFGDFVFEKNSDISNPKPAIVDVPVVLASIEEQKKSPGLVLSENQPSSSQVGLNVLQIEQSPKSLLPDTVRPNPLENLQKNIATDPSANYPNIDEVNDWNKNKKTFDSEILKVVEETQEERLSYDVRSKDILLSLDTMGQVNKSNPNYSRIVKDIKGKTFSFIQDLIPESKNRAKILENLNKASSPKEISNVIKAADKEFFRSQTIKGESLYRTIEQKTGVRPTEKFISMKETELLRQRLKAESFSAKKADMAARRELINRFRLGQESVQQTINYIKEKLPPEQAGKFINAVKNSTSAMAQAKIFVRVDNLAQELEIKNAKEDLELLSKNLSKSIKRLAGFKNVALSYSKKINDIVGQIDFKNLSKSSRSKLISLSEYISKNPDAQIPDYLNTKLKRLTKVPLNSMSVEDKAELKGTLDNLVSLGKLKLKLEQRHNARVKNNALGKLVSGTRNLDPSSDNFWQYGAKKFYINTMTAPRVFDAIDGYANYKGSNVSLWKSISESEINAQYEYKVEFGEALEAIRNISNDWTQSDMLAMAYHLYKEQGGVEQTSAIMQKYGLKQEPKLSAKHRQAMNVMKSYLGKNTDAIASIYEHYNNQEFYREKNYFPFLYEDDFSHFPQDAIQHDFNRKSKTQQGFTISRVGPGDKIPRVDVFKVFSEALRNQVWYKHLEIPIREANTLVKSPEYREKAGKLASTYWADFLDSISRKGFGHNYHSDLILKNLRINMGNAILGFRASTIMLQPMAVFPAMGYVQSVYGPKAAGEVFLEFSKSWISPQYAKDYISGSKSLTLREGAGELGLEEILSEANYKNKFYIGYVNAGMSLMRKSDILTAAGTQIGIEKILRRNGADNSKREAEFLMNMLNSSSNVSYRPLILSKGDLARTFFTFQNYSMNLWGILWHDLILSGQIKSDGWKNKANSAIGLNIALGGILAEEMARSWLADVFGKEREFNPMQEYVLGIPKNIPYFGAFVDLVANPGYSSAPPLIKTMENLFRATGRGKTAKQIESVLTLTGVPGTSQAFDIYELLSK